MRRICKKETIAQKAVLEWKNREGIMNFHNPSSPSGVWRDPFDTT